MSNIVKGWLPERILFEVATWRETVPISAKSLLHLGTRAAVGQALSRLSRRGQLLRVGHGLYVRQTQTRFGVRTPDVAAVLSALQSGSGEIIASGGAAAANQLRLTKQVPVRLVYLTSGRTRYLKLGVQIVELRHVSRWQLTLAGRPAGTVIRALAWGGRERGSALAAQLRDGLSHETILELSRVRSRLPSWMVELLSALIAPGSTDSRSGRILENRQRQGTQP